MPPCARDDLRGKQTDSSSAAFSPPVTGPLKKRIGELTEDEISIDSKIYNIKDFKHPGGDIVKLFGGNNVTEQYKMIHAAHSLKPDYFLGRMKAVGQVTDFEPEYSWGSEFEKEMKREIFKIVPPHKHFGTPGYFFRAFFYIGFMTVMQGLWCYYGSSVTIAVLLGAAQALIGLNVQHDANHGAASRKYWVNELLGYGADMIGGSKYSWIEQHWTHHAYTNHNEKDGDALSAEPLMLFNDYPKGDPRRKWYHNFQGLYFLPMLSFYWLSSVFNPQLLDLKHAGTKHVMNWENSYIKGKVAISLGLRFLYICMNVISPFFRHDVGTAVYHIWIMSTVESLFLSGLFSLSHNFEGADRDPTMEARGKDGKPVDWFKAQVETSSTYGSFISSWITGGLNHQIEHHLFPRMSSSYYPVIAPKVREICEKHGVKYHWYPWIHQNLVATFTYMHRAGVGSHWEFKALHGAA